MQTANEMAELQQSPTSTSSSRLSTATTVVDGLDTCEIRLNDEEARLLALCLHLDDKIISERYFRSGSFKWTAQFWTSGFWDATKFMGFFLGCEVQHLVRVYSAANGTSFSILPSARPLIASASSNLGDDVVADDLFDLLFTFLKVEDETEASCQDRQETIDHLDAALPFLERSSCYQQIAVGDFLLFIELAARRYAAQGHFFKAKALLEPASSSYADHQAYPQALQVQNQLAVVHGQEGDLKKAETLLQSTLAHKRNVYGAQHCFTLQALDDLANVQYSAGDLEGATRILEELVDLKIRLFAPLNASTLLSQNNLAIVRAAQGRYQEAQYLHTMVATERQKTLAPGHVDLAVSFHNLATIYSDQAQYQLAIEHYDRALAMREQTLGPSHILTICTLGSCGMTLAFAGNFEDAEAKLKPALAAAETRLGPAHMLALKTRESLGILYGLQGEHRASAPYLEKAHRMLCDIRGLDHPDALSAAHNLAFCYQQRGWTSEAEKAYEHALRREVVLGPDHPLTIATKRNHESMRGM